MPDVSTMPDLSTPRARLDKDLPQTYGITPFVLGPRDAEEKPDVMPVTATASDGKVSVSFPGTKTESGMETPDLRVTVATYLSDAPLQLLNPSP
jgi:hypothetical protein